MIITAEEIAEAQQNGEKLQQFLNTESALNLARFLVEEQVICCDISISENRFYIPKPSRRQVFDTVHRLSHPGRATAKLISRKFVWPYMKRDIKQWASICQPCQRSKIHRHKLNLPDKITVPDGRLNHIHLDIIDPLPACNDFWYCLTFIVRFSR